LLCDFILGDSGIQELKNLGIRDSYGYGNRNAEFAPVKYAPLLSAQISRGKEVRDLKFRYTWDIIEAAENGLLPDKIMLNVHPQRWDDRFWPWVSPSETLLRRMPSACFTG